MMQTCLKDLGIEKINAGVFTGEWRSHGPVIERFSPIDGKLIGLVREATAEDYERAVTRAEEAFLKWRQAPAPMRGETIRRLGNALREAKPELARLVTIESGKILAEALGEVQEMIDVCDFAVGLSRQLYGLTIQSERPKHRLMEQWHPLGLVGVITAFNFPRRGLGLELRPGGRVWGRHVLEAVEQDSIDCHRRHAHRRARLPGDRRGPGDFHARPGRR
jgi:aldehyde dehydrogenase (NAD+)